MCSFQKFTFTFCHSQTQTAPSVLAYLLPLGISHFDCSIPHSIPNDCVPVIYIYEYTICTFSDFLGYMNPSIKPVNRCIRSYVCKRYTSFGLACADVTHMMGCTCLVLQFVSQSTIHYCSENPRAG